MEGKMPQTKGKTLPFTNQHDVMRPPYLWWPNKPLQNQCKILNKLQEFGDQTRVGL